MNDINFNKFDDEYLIALTNKGIVKRAYKDMEINDLSDNPDGTIIIGSDIKVKLNENISQSICSCPSQSICKHIIMAVLYEKQKTLNNENVNIIKTNIEDILEIDDNMLLKIIGNTGIKKLYYDIENNRFPIIEEKNIIYITLDTEHLIKLLFPISNSICSCKSSDMCKHKALAILYYKAFKGKLNLKKEDTIKISNKELNSIREFTDRIQKEISHILNVGLSRLSYSNIQYFEKLALMAHNVKLANHEKMCREISGMFEAYFNSDIYFNENQLLKKISDCYLLAEKINSTNDLVKISSYMGTFKDEYMINNDISLIPVGSRYTETLGGYAGNIYYYLCEDNHKVYSYSNLRPTFYDYTYDENIQTFMWNSDYSIDEITNFQFRLIKPRINENMQISSSTQTRLQVEKEIEKDLPIKFELLTYDFRTLIKIEDRCENEKVAFLMVNSIISYGFDHIKQIFSIEIKDSNGYPILLELKNTLDNKKYIKLLNYYAKKPVNGILAIGIVYISEGCLKMIPITFIEDFKSFETGSEVTK